MDISAITLFLAGDVMCGRGIDQILPHPVHPQLFESFVKSARDYVELAEGQSAPIPRSVGWDYVWGDALAELNRLQPHARIVNLETAVTARGEPWPAKGIHYRMHPANVPCLTAAGLDCCVLANNHVLDWGYDGLSDTLATLHRARLCTTGAGLNQAEAEAPACIEVPGKGRVLVLAMASDSGGVPPSWEAAAERAGVSRVPDFSAQAAQALAGRAAAARREGDVVVVSMHWGGNWGFQVPAEQRSFARRLIDSGSVDVVFGHSSHHAKGIEVYHDRLILYGCGDLLNDYEGIGGYDSYRPGLGLMYFASFDAQARRLVGLTMVPIRIERFQILRASDDETAWLLATLNREGQRFGTGVEQRNADLLLRWT